MSTDKIFASKMENFSQKVVEDKLSKCIVLQSLSIVWNFPYIFNNLKKIKSFLNFLAAYIWQHVFYNKNKKNVCFCVCSYEGKKANTLLFFLYFFIDKVIYCCLDISTLNFWILSFFGRYQKLIFFIFSSYE